MSSGKTDEASSTFSKRDDLLSGQRSSQIDFIRGIVILDMMLVHYCGFLTDFSGGDLVGKLIGYTDIAMEGFIFLFAMMIGKYYYKRFLKDKRAVVRRLLRRFLEVWAIHYVMIATICIPMALMTGDKVTKGRSIGHFMLESFLFLNQVPLLHILPTFLPLFIFAIPGLWLLEKRKKNILLLISGIFFLVGNFHPYLLNVGEKSIFPIILWQIYFVIGLIAGKRSYEKEQGKDIRTKKQVVNVLFCFIIMCCVYFGHHFLPVIESFRNFCHIEVVKFPVNIYGFLYRGSLLYLVVFIIKMAWTYIEKMKALNYGVSILGRHSLTSFVVHVYFAKLISTLDWLDFIGSMGSLLLIAANIIFTIIALTLLETWKKQGNDGILGDTEKNRIGKGLA